MIRHLLRKVSVSRDQINNFRHSNGNISLIKIFMVNILPENGPKILVEQFKISYRRFLTRKTGEILKIKNGIQHFGFHPFTSVKNSTFKTLISTLKSIRYIGFVILGYCIFKTFCTTVGYPAAINGKSMQPTFNPEKKKEAEMDVYGRNIEVNTREVNYGGCGCVESSVLDILNIIGPVIMQDWVWVNCWRGSRLDISRGDLLIYISPKDPDEFLIKRVIAVENDLVRTDGRWSEETGNDDLVRIPRGHAWVQGDNLSNTVDSNKYGPVSLGLTIGVATHIVWPPGRISKLNSQAGLRLHSNTIVWSDRPEPVEKCLI